MKNVLILTDFSAGAMRAAENALPVVAKLGAEILLINVYPITPYIPPVGSAVMPQSSAAEKRRVSTSRLNNETRRLQKRLAGLKLNGYMPVIRPMALEGQLAERVAVLARRKKSTLIIMGVSPNSYGDLLFAGDVKAVLQQISCPVLVIPAEWTRQEIRHIVFGTDLAATDDRVIDDLVSIAARLKAKVSLSHISRPVIIPDFAEETRVSAFTGKITERYPGIGWLTAREHNVIDALEKIGEEKHADVIALRYQKHAFWYHLFNENPLKEAIQRAKTPLLIFPEIPRRHE
ncbi:MAG: universal stress protein [Mucilaginibacter sp.]